MNQKPGPGDNFIHRKVYRYTFPKPKIITIIWVDIYAYNICVISFFEKGKGNDKTKFKLRHNYHGLHVLYILKACLATFMELRGHTEPYALFFNAANDINDYREDNPRNSAYGTFFKYYLPGYYTDYRIIGSLKLNITGIIPNAHPFLSETTKFYDWFAKSVEQDMNTEETDK